jgi:glycosyltransferase involved in cell wall biosynthesis
VKRITLVSGGNVSTNPRVVSAADALHAAGHQVRVVAIDALPDNAARDAAIMARRTWRLDRVNLRHGETMATMRRAASTLLQAVSRRAHAAGVSAPGVVDRLVSRYVGALTRVAAAEPADVVLGYTLGALPAALRAATRLGAIAGFDIEDLHSGELPDALRDSAMQRAIVAVERRYLPRCRTLTAASDGIADGVVAAYGLPRPQVILNTFPLSERLATPAPPRSRPSLYWFSAVIGRDRGIEDALGAMAMLDVPVDLHVRGSIDSQYEAELKAHAQRLGVGDRVFLWPQAPPPELVALAGAHDIGLAIEPPVTRSRMVSVSNKLMVYFVSGIAVAATNLPGQRSAMDDAPGAGFLYSSGDVAALAAGLKPLVTDPQALARAKAASKAAAERRFNWEADGSRLVSYLEAAWGER